MIRSAVIIYHLLIFAAVAPAAARTVCYTPNGTDRNGLPDVKGAELFQPCKTTSSDEHQMCCNINHTCRPDGLCVNKDESQVWREACTDRTWQHPNCLKLCSGDTIGFNGIPLNATDSRITVCDNGSLCCGPIIGTGSCCQKGEGFHINSDRTIVPFTVVQPPQSTSSPSPSLNADTPSATQSTGSSKTALIGTIVGAVVGGVAAILLLLAAFVLFLRRIDRQRASQHHNGNLPGESPGLPAYRSKAASIDSLVELQQATVRSPREMMVSETAQELGGQFPRR